MGIDYKSKYKAYKNQLKYSNFIIINENVINYIVEKLYDLYFICLKGGNYKNGSKPSC